MVASSAGGGKMRKSTLRNTTARVLVLGDRQVGKSAAIVRYTTGRYIQNYCSSTADWLYKHPIGYDSARNQYKLVELLEQADIKFNTKLDEEEAEVRQQRANRAAASSLSSRVALDRQIDNEFYEKQQLLNKLHWANAYVIVYALNDSQSFNKAIKYLNLIANEINQQPQVARGGGGRNAFTTASYQFDKSDATQTQQPARRPILLLGNKRDLLNGDDGQQQQQQQQQPKQSKQPKQPVRRVSHADGRLLAMRHQCLFAELSISEASKPIELALTNLIESIHPSELHTSRPSSLSSELSQLDQCCPSQTQLTHWIPPSPTEFHFHHASHQQPSQHQNHNNHKNSNNSNRNHHGSHCQMPLSMPTNNKNQSHHSQAAGHLIKSHVAQSYSSSQQIVQSSCLAVKAKRLSEADFRLLTPAGLSTRPPSASTPTSSSTTHSSSDSSSSASSASSASGTITAASSPLVPLQPQVAWPLRAAARHPQTAATAAGAAVEMVQVVCGPLETHQVAGAAQLLTARPSISSTSSSVSSAGSRTQLGSRYASLKSSFRKASLAIVGSRSLAAARTQGGGGGGGGNKLASVTASSAVPSERPSVSSSRINEIAEEAQQQHHQQQQLNVANRGIWVRSAQNVALAGATSDSDSSASLSTLNNSESGQRRSSSQRINWIKSKISSLSRQDIGGGGGGSSNSTETSSMGLAESLNEAAPLPPGASASRFRRPLFKYKSRRKTVAFEPTFKLAGDKTANGIGMQPAAAGQGVGSRPQSLCQVSVWDGETGSGSDSMAVSQADLTPRANLPSATANPLGECRNHSYNALTYDSPLAASQGPPMKNAHNNSTGSLTTNESLVMSSIFIIGGTHEEPTHYPRSDAMMAGELGPDRRSLSACRRQQSNTMSRASTSTGGSYDEDSELDECRPRTTTNQSKMPISSSGGGGGGGKQQAKSRYQLVKSVQSTLTSLARSGNVTPPKAASVVVGVKRSFCNALFSGKSSPVPGAIATATATKKIDLIDSQTALVGRSQLAKVERIQAIPLMGFCK